METAQIIDDALYQYYTIENDLPVPNWRTIKDLSGGYNISKIWDLTLETYSATIPLHKASSWITNLIHQSGIVKDT